MKDRFKFRCFFADENKMYFYDYFLPAYCMDEKEAHFMQCTGLKDKNGKLIYEGDIVKITREKWTKERYNRFYIVCWDRTQWQLGLIKYQRAKAQPNRRPDRKMPFKNIVSFADYTPLKEFALCKVIGNIYENPELLESN